MHFHQSLIGDETCQDLVPDADVYCGTFRFIKLFFYNLCENILAKTFKFNVIKLIQFFKRPASAIDTCITMGNLTDKRHNNKSCSNRAKR